MNTTYETDVVVVGTGAAAMSAAITAAHNGLKVIVIESTDKWGGSTSMSGGGMWMPNNRLMQRDGAGDSREEAIKYIEGAVNQAGDPGKGFTRERVEAFVDNVNGFIDMTEGYGAVYVRSKDYPDYYPEMEGGKVGRAIEVKPVDAKPIGDDWKTSRGQDGAAIPFMTDDVWEISRAWSTASGFVRGARFVGRTVLSLLKGQKAMGMGPGLAVTMWKIMKDQGTEIMLNTPMTDLVFDGDRVAGVKASKDGKDITISARKGVFLGSGGFDHNAEMRKKYHGFEGYSSGNPGNLGLPINIAAAHGAELSLMEDAWWGGSIPGPDAEHGPSFLVSERSMPFSIIVDAEGKRFANESESYVDLGHNMLENMKTTPGKMWMILDRRHTRRYLRTFSIMPGLEKGFDEKGIKHTAKTLDELAGKIGVDKSVFRQTIERWNANVGTGRDQDYKRGDSVYDRYYGDPTVRPNPNLGAIEKGPFMAYELVPGDLGTKGGVVTDEKARVLREDGSVIKGLYAGGNCSASVMGRTYPGPGSTLAPAAVFGYIAGNDLATG